MVEKKFGLENPRDIFLKNGRSYLNCRLISCFLRVFSICNYWFITSFQNNFIRSKKCCFLEKSWKTSKEAKNSQKQLFFGVPKCVDFDAEIHRQNTQNAPKPSFLRGFWDFLKRWKQTAIHEEKRKGRVRENFLSFWNLQKNTFFLQNARKEANFASWIHVWP